MPAPLLFGHTGLPLTTKWAHAVRAPANAAARDPEARRRPHPSPLWSHVASLTTKWAHAGWDPANAAARDPAAWRRPHPSPLRLHVSSLPTKWVHAGRPLRQPTPGALLSQRQHLHQARPAHRTTAACLLVLPQVYVQTMRAPMLKRSSVESSRKRMKNCHKLVLFELIWRDYFRFHPAKYGNSIFLLVHTHHVRVFTTLSSSTNARMEQKL
ncbi:hypothetical protein ACQJBY_005044 [Aegilops geniculata]